MDKDVRVNNITKTFHLSKKQRKIERTENPLKVAVNDLSFVAKSSEIYGLLGPNGAGKTTTLRMISTLIKPDQGDIFVSGHSVKDDATNVRKVLGFLTSDLKLEEFFTPNYLFDYFAALHGLDLQTAEQRKQELFGKFGIDQFREVKVGELSSGMRQKVQIAVALVHDPDVIVFDEPTNGLDILTAKTVTDYLMELRDAGKTIIISTHIFSLVEKICDRVGIIVNGKMKLDKPLSEISKNEQDLETIFFDLVKEESEEA